MTIEKGAALDGGPSFPQWFVDLAQRSAHGIARSPGESDEEYLDRAKRELEKGEVSR